MVIDEKIDEAKVKEIVQGLKDSKENCAKEAKGLDAMKVKLAYDLGIRSVGILIEHYKPSIEVLKKAIMDYKY